jgi:methanogenic corrinoid protein MtbC1
MASIQNLDMASLEQALTDATVNLSRLSFVQEVVVPLFREIGEQWRSGGMKPVGEHMVSVVIRSMLWDMVRAVEVVETAPRIFCATPVGHMHEFGALATALVAAESGWKPFYFGPNLPSEEIVYAVNRLEAKALSLSLCHDLSDRHLIVELKKVRRMLDRQVPVFIGGSGVHASAEVIDRLGAVTVTDLEDFRNRLESLAGG